MQGGTRFGKMARVATTATLLVAASGSAWLLTYWFWQFSVRTQPPTLGLESDPTALAATLKSGHLFGSSVDLAGRSAAAPPNMALTGVITGGWGRGGVAVISIAGGRPTAFREGDDVAPGVALSRVAADHVELSRQGRRVELSLPVRK